MRNSRCRHVIVVSCGCCSRCGMYRCQGGGCQGGRWVCFVIIILLKIFEQSKFPLAPLWYTKLLRNVSFHQCDLANLVGMYAIAILGMDDAELTEYSFGGS